MVAVDDDDFNIIDNEHVVRVRSNIYVVQVHIDSFTKKTVAKVKLYVVIQLTKADEVDDIENILLNLDYFIKMVPVVQGINNVDDQRVNEDLVEKAEASSNYLEEVISVEEEVGVAVLVAVN